MNGHAVLITGASGSGKSGLALQLIALGAKLIADDQTQLSIQGKLLFASKPETLPALIEARGVGLLKTQMADACQVALAIDLDTSERDRFPKPLTKIFHGRKITVWRKVTDAHFPAAIMVYLSNIPNPLKLKS